MAAYNIISSILVLIALPFFMGRASSASKDRGYISTYMMGYVIMQGLYFIVYAFGVYRHQTGGFIRFSNLGVLFVFLCIFYIIIRSWIMKNNGMTLSEIFFPKALDFSLLKGANAVFFVILFIIIGYELIRTGISMPRIDGDDVIYIPLISEMVDINTLYGTRLMHGGPLVALQYGFLSYKYMLTSYYPYIATLCTLTHIHPLIMCRTVLSLHHVLIAYGMAYLYGEMLFEAEKDAVIRFRKELIFMIVYGVLLEAGNYTYYTISRRVLVWNYNSKSMLFIIIAPFLALELYRYFEKSRSGLISLLFIVIAAVSSSLMGSGMAAIIVGIFTVIYAVKNKSFWPVVRGAVLMVPCLISAGLAVIIVRYIA